MNTGVLPSLLLVLLLIAQAYLLLLLFALPLFKNKLKVCVSPLLGKFIGVIFPNMCLLHVFVSHYDNSCSISSFFMIILFVMVICNQQFLMLLLCWFWTWLHKSVNLINRYMYSDFSNSQLFPIFTHLFRLPYTVRHNCIEIRSINNPTVALTCLLKGRVAHFLL